MSEAIRVLVADDQALVREGLLTLLQTAPGIEPVGAVGDGEEAVTACGRLAPDVVLMDLHMPRLDGVEATRRIRASRPRIEIVVLTTYADEASILEALRAGARGYLTKDAGIAEITRAVQAAASGQGLLDPVVQERLLAAAGPGGSPGAGGDSAPSPGARAGAGANQRPAASSRSGVGLPDGLTAREAEVLALIARGLSNREIAQELVVSEATVKTHVNHLFAKTGARDRAQAVHYAYTHGLTR